MSAPTVLFVDDDLNVLQSMSRSFQRQPFRVRIAAGPEEALALVEADWIDVVVADQHMPGMLGTELLSRLRRERPALIRILLTGASDFETAQQAINEGQVYRYLTKPCPHAALLAAIRQALNHRALLDESRRLQARMVAHVAELGALRDSCREAAENAGSGGSLPRLARSLAALAERMSGSLELADAGLRECVIQAGWENDRPAGIESIEQRRTS